MRREFGLSKLKMKKAPLLPSLVVIFAILIVAVRSVYAQNNKNDPRLNGCSNDAKSLDSASKRVKVPYDIERNGKIVVRKGEWIAVVVELRWSRRCQARWVKAIVPKDTQMYLKDNYGNKYVKYIAQVNGQNYTDMWKDNRPLSACIKHPTYEQELCTSFQ
ncbi:DUF2690 domain-containing protein [Microcoleus sp. herbarium2]